jgi:hypothetical protein
LDDGNTSMRVEQGGLAVWFGTADAPAPSGAVEAATGTDGVLASVTVGVQPPSASNSVAVTYRRNGDDPVTVPTVLVSHDPLVKAQYFMARFPEFHVGDVVDYFVVARSPGLQVPGPQEASQFMGSFQVVPDPPAEDGRDFERPAVSPGHLSSPAVLRNGGQRSIDTFRGQLESNTTELVSFEGYRVALTVQRTTTTQAHNGTETTTVDTRRQTGMTARNGAFAIKGVSDDDKVAELRVYAPSGAEVHVGSQYEIDGARVVTIDPAATVQVASVGVPTQRSFLLRGFVVDKATLQPAPAGLTISVWLKPKAGSAAATPLDTAVTAKGGSFELAVNVPDGDGLEARLGSDSENTASVPSPGEGQRSVTAILPLELAPEAPTDATADQDCACNDAAPARLPDATSLATDPSYSADLGGRCVQFTVPNRALEEFDLYSIVRTTDPALQPITLSDDPEGDLLAGVTARAPLPPASPVAPRQPSVPPPAPPPASPVAPRQPSAPPPAPPPAAASVTDPVAFRLSADRATVAPQPVLADRTPVAATTVRDFAKLVAPAADSLAVVKAFRRPRLAALSAELRRELNSRPDRTAVSETTPIDWDDTPTINQAVSIAHGHLLHWRQTWRSDGYSLGDLLYSLPLAAGQTRRVAIVDWERSELASRGEQTYFDEALQNFSSHDRDLSEVVHGAVSEGLSGGSHATTAGIGTGSGGAGMGSYGTFSAGGVFGISGGAGYADAAAFQSAARMASADSAQTLRELTMQSASATRGVRSTTVVSVGEDETARATTEIVANHNHCHAITVQYFEVLRHLRVDTELVDVQECLFVPLTMRPFDPGKVLRWRKELQPTIQDPDLAGSFDALQRVATQWKLTGAPLNRYADEQVQTISGELKILISVPAPPPPPDLTLQKMAIANAEAAGEAGLNVASAAVNAGPDWVKGIQTFLTLGASDSARAAALASNAAAADTIRRQADFQMAMLDRQPSDRSRYDFFFTYAMPRFAASFVDQLSVVVTDDQGTARKLIADFTLVDSYVPGTPLRVTFNVPDVTGVTRAAIRSITIRSELPLPTGCRAIAYGMSAEYSTMGFDHTLVNQPRVVDDIDCGEFAYTDTSVNAVTLARLLAGPGVTVRCPIDAWEQRMPRLDDIRLAAALLDHLNDHLEQYHQVLWWSMNPNRRFMLLDGFLGPNGRSLASSIENRLMAIVGNSLVFPVARGLNLDPSIRTKTSAETPDLLRAYRRGNAVLPYRISFPTRGVFAESVMGSCNSCEDIDDSKNWRWEQSPIDEVPAPTADTASRRTAPQDLAPTMPPAPIISQQAPTPVPDPVGLAALIGLLNNVNFRDVTGLSANQANAAAALQQNVAAALEYGKEASKLAQQADLSRSKDQYFDALDKAKQKGAITDDQYKELTAARLKAMSTGATTNDSDAAKARLAVVQQAKDSGLLDAAAAKNAAAAIVTSPGQPAANAAASKINQIPAGVIKSVQVTQGDQSTRLDQQDLAYTPVGYRPGSSAPPLPSLDTDAAAHAYQAVVDLVSRSASPSGDDFYATMNELKQLNWSDLTPVLERLVADGPSLDGMTWLELFYQRMAGMTGVDDRVLAATIAVLLGHGRVIRDATDVTKAGSLAEILLRLPGEDQVKVLERLGLRDEAAEGALSILSAAAIQAGLMQSPIAAGAMNFDFGDWDLPGDMPVPYYIGTAAHLAIAAFYRTEHPDPEHYVASNFVPVQSIVDKLVSDFGFAPGQIDTKYLGRMPDIFEFSTIHLPPGRVYEIKPWTLAGVAEAKAGMYYTALTQAHIPVVLGEMGFPGTEGFVPAPNGYFLFESPAEGVIAYQYLQASPAEIDARDRARGRKSRRHVTVEALQAAIPVVATAGSIRLAAALLDFLTDYGFTFLLAGI